FAFARESWTTAIVPWPSVELCRLASRRGVLLIADLRRIAGITSAGVAGVERSEPPVISKFADLATALQRVAPWPAVVAAIVDAETLLSLELAGAARNLLLGVYSSVNRPLPAGSKAQIIFAEVADPAAIATMASATDKPVIAVRCLPNELNFERARAACD